jgi:integrase/recombinase XerD
MSALKQVFPRVHYRYDECPYADDLEHFAAWLCARAYRNKPARTHLYNVQRVLISLTLVPSSTVRIWGTLTDQASLYSRTASVVS